MEVTGYGLVQGVVARSMVPELDHESGHLCWTAKGLRDYVCTFSEVLIFSWALYIGHVCASFHFTFRLFGFVWNVIT